MGSTISSLRGTLILLCSVALTLSLAAGARDGKRDDVDGGPGNDRGQVDHQDWISLLESLL